MRRLSADRGGVAPATAPRTLLWHAPGPNADGVEPRAELRGALPEGGLSGQVSRHNDSDSVFIGNRHEQRVVCGGGRHGVDLRFSRWNHRRPCRKSVSRTPLNFDLDTDSDAEGSLSRFEMLSIRLRAKPAFVEKSVGSVEHAGHGRLPCGLRNGAVVRRQPSGDLQHRPGLPVHVGRSGSSARAPAAPVSARNTRPKRSLVGDRNHHYRSPALGSERGANAGRFP